VNPYFAPMFPSQPGTLAGRGEANNVFRAFRYAPEDVPRLRA